MECGVGQIALYPSFNSYVYPTFLKNALFTIDNHSEIRYNQNMNGQNKVTRKDTGEIEMKKFNKSTVYTSESHAPRTGILGVGNIVAHKNDKNDKGRVLQANQEKALVQFRTQTEWYKNEELLVQE